jgi:hypothetical protein
MKDYELKGGDCAKKFLNFENTKNVKHAFASQETL